MLRLHVLAGHSCKLLQAYNRALRPHNRCLHQHARTSKSHSRPVTFSAYKSSAAFSSQPHYSALGLDRAGHVRSEQRPQITSVTDNMEVSHLYANALMRHAGTTLQHLERPKLMWVQSWFQCSRG